MQSSCIIFVMNAIQTQLRNAGYRNSKTRNEIISVICASCKMFQAQDVIDQLPEVDRVTVYRTIELLSSLDIIHPTMQKDGAQYYELHGLEHHHHAMCTNCDAQECVECEIPPVPGKHHTIYYSYTCAKCT